jgi:hypothetical protein
VDGNHIADSRGGLPRCGLNAELPCGEPAVYSVTATAAVGSYDYDWNWGACPEPFARLRVNSARGR